MRPNANLEGASAGAGEQKDDDHIPSGRAIARAVTRDIDDNSANTPKEAAPIENTHTAPKATRA